MSLPTDQELKDYLKAETDEEDLLIQAINLSAQAWVRAFYNVPLTQQSRTFTGRWPGVGAQHRRDTRLVVPITPCDVTATITDRDGATVDSTTYVIDGRTGWIDAKRDVRFANPPYDLEIQVGWALHPEYATDIDPILRQAVLWAASTYYRNRNVAATYEQSGGQVSITYTTAEVPPLLRSLMAGIRVNAWFA